MVVGVTSAVGASAGGHARQAAGIPRGYAQVDPRNPARSQQVFLGQPLSGNAPIFPGDPKVKWQLWNCMKAHPGIPPLVPRGPPAGNRLFAPRLVPWLKVSRGRRPWRRRPLTRR